MIFYLETTLDNSDGGTEPEKGLVIVSTYGEAAKQIEEAIFDCLTSIGKLEGVAGANTLYLANNSLREPLIQSIKKKAVW